MTNLLNVIDAHYFVLPSQGNVYSLTRLCMSEGINKILVASLRRKIFSFEFIEDAEGFLKPAVKEVLFTYIPSGAEIISIDAFNKSDTSNDFVIGITIIKSSGDNSPETYLNIYSDWEPSSEFNLDSVAQNCLSLELHFVPYHLYHTELPVEAKDNPSREIVWLLSGSDEEIHMFREDKLNHCYSQVDVTEYFPEFVDMPSIVLWIDVHYCKEYNRRLSAVGCECGYVRISVVDVLKRELISSWSAGYEGPVSTVRFFTLEPLVKCPEFLFNHGNPQSEGLSKKDEERNIVDLDIHCLVTNTLQSSVVYMNVEKHGFSNPVTLSDSEKYDCCLCSAVADIDMDGEPEILLGTYGQEMLVYKYHPASEDQEEKWELAGQRSFANPIHSLMYLDVTGDGVQELIVLTLKGIQILQHDPDELLNIFVSRMERLAETHSAVIT